MALFVKTVDSIDNFLNAEQEAMPKQDPPEFLLTAAGEVPDDREPGQGADNNTPEVDPEFPIKLTKAVKDDVKGKLALFGTLVALPLDMADPYCGRALSENLDNMIDKAMPLIGRSPAAVKFLTSTSGGLLDWVGFLQACWPVLQAIYAHHLGRTVVKDPKTGAFIRKSANGSAVNATMPLRDFDYTAE
jgi:hypothetical protein